MNNIEAIAILGAPIFFFVACLSALSASSRMLTQNAAKEEERRSCEGSWLIWLNFLLILAILVWRVM